jgi:signal transduction histidine kinase
MTDKQAEIRGSSHFVVFRSLRTKLLTLTIMLSLLPLAGISAISYFIGSRQIAEDRIKLTLEKMSQDTADKIDLILHELKQEALYMATTLPLMQPSLGGAQRGEITLLLNNYCFNHDVYDLLIVVDAQGKIVGINTIDRSGKPLPAEPLRKILHGSINDYPEESAIFGRSIAGNSSHHDWYSSRLVQNLYGSQYQKEDASHQYNIAYSEPIQSPRTHEILGVWINIINWSYIQTRVDDVEQDLAALNLPTGYAFMYAKDANTIIAHKYRGGRTVASRPEGMPTPYQNLYHMKLVENLGLKNLHDAVVRQDRSFAYEFPRGTKKISGFSPIDDASFGWTVGVGIDDADIFRPINKLAWWLGGISLMLAILVVISTFLLAHGITVPLKNLIRTAQTIAQGNLSQRVSVRSSDEIGVLGSTFNDMARALETRENQLQELNKNLEKIVRQRTMELEKSHDALKQAYVDLQNAQEQLVQTEKMASLGQLVAGIAHEIKNPLNFIYGNTGFLSDYIAKLQALLEKVETLPSISQEDKTRIANLKEECNYDFIKGDLRILIDNFSEGARRINTIVSDLRTFSRMDTESVSEVDLHAALEITLNLLRNQYKNRVTIHKEYGSIPRIQGYSGKLNQVFMNLLSNAFHAIRDQGEVWIRTRSANGTVEVEIEDTGSGIPKEYLNRIFEPFFTTKPVGQGTGLGLSISYGIIQQHHGKIHVTSAMDKGSTFTVRLPVFQEKGGE